MKIFIVSVFLKIAPISLIVGIQGMCTCHSAKAEVRGQILGVGLSPSSMGFWGQDSGFLAWLQVHLMTEPESPRSSAFVWD